MLIIDDLLLFPITSLKWVFRQVAAVVDQELTDDSAVRDQLLELQMRLETGDITEEDYTREEADLMRRLREARALRRQMEGDPGDGEDDFISYR
ncbi:MAG: gas vesicle protein GvpG [Chloroflexota bacterium]